MEKDLGRLIRKMREERGMSLKTLAGKLGVSARQVHGFENGEGLNVTRLIQIANAFYVPVSAFMDCVKADMPDSTCYPGLLPDEAMLLALYRGLQNHELKTSFIALLKSMHDSGSR
jgi:transcriptional regulator with XRE-family HTH domain